MLNREVEIDVDGIVCPVKCLVKRTENENENENGIEGGRILYLLVRCEVTKELLIEYDHGEFEYVLRNNKLSSEALKWAIAEFN